MKPQEILQIEKELAELYPANEYTATHRKRLALSYLWIAPLLSPKKLLLELGGTGDFTDYLKRKHPEITVENTEGDLRYPLAIESDRYDLVLNMEILEHIKDTDQGEIHLFGLEGVQTFLSESYRVTRPGGKMFLTTPNAHSLDNVEKILTLQPPVLFRPHVREYTFWEVETFGREAGFSLSRGETYNPWKTVEGKLRRDAERLAMGAQGSLSRMGQDIFMLFEKN
jgi:SAM-dependent methyltransferase